MRRFNHPARTAAFRRRLRRQHSPAALITHLPNIRYLCGFTGSSGMLALTANQAAFFTDGRYLEQAGREIEGTEIVIGKSALEGATLWLKQCLGSTTVFQSRGRHGERASAVAYEGSHLTVSQFASIRKTLRRSIHLEELDNSLDEMRMLKDSDEISSLRAAAKLGAGLLPVALEAIRPGVKETEIAAEMEYAARSRGAEAMAFSTIVASGPRSALVHGRASANPVPRSGFVVLDFGVILCGYCSDRTRTVHVGKPSPRARALYNAVREAQEAAVNAVRPGLRFEQVDAAARQVLERHGLAAFFTHSTGHGVGLEIHEPPRLGVGQKGHLQPGMVITVEPGVYIPGEGGVRIEDMVLVTPRGHEVLAPGGHDLLVL